MTGMWNEQRGVTKIVRRQPWRDLRRYCKREKERQGEKGEVMKKKGKRKERKGVKIKDGKSSMGIEKNAEMMRRRRKQKVAETWK